MLALGVGILASSFFSSSETEIQPSFPLSRLNLMS